MKLVMCIVVASLIALEEATAQTPEVVCKTGAGAAGPPKLACNPIAEAQARHSCLRLDLALRKFGRLLEVARGTVEQMRKAEDDIQNRMLEAINGCQTSKDDLCSVEFQIQTTLADFQAQENRLNGHTGSASDTCETTTFREAEEIMDCLVRRAFAFPEDRPSICRCYDGLDNDGNGLVDCEDASCHDSETGLYHPGLDELQDE